MVSVMDSDEPVQSARSTIILFLVAAFALDWVGWIIAGAQSGWVIDESSGIWGPLLAVSMFGPLASAVIVRVTRKTAVDAGWRPRIKGGVRWYMLALAIPPALTLAGSAVYFLFFSGDFDPEASRFSAAAIAQLGVGTDQVPAIFAIQVANAVIFAPFINMLLAIGEEAGWRGFLYPAMREQMPRRRAAILTGAAWGLWHAPLIAMGYNYGSDYLGFPVLGIVAMTIFCMAFGTFLCFLRERSGSVWPCALAHGSLNAVAGLGMWFSRSAGGILGPMPLGLLGCIPVVLLAVWLLGRLGAPGAGAAR
jgi:membrane protease YdiL (CAAX protease family)